MTIEIINKIKQEIEEREGCLIQANFLVEEFRDDSKWRNLKLKLECYEDAQKEILEKIDNIFINRINNFGKPSTFVGHGYLEALNSIQNELKVSISSNTKGGKK